jgi:hypothetical protein
MVAKAVCTEPKNAPSYTSERLDPPPSPSHTRTRTHNVIFITRFQSGDFEQGHSKVGMLLKGILFLSHVTVWPYKYEVDHMLCPSLFLTLVP